MEFQQLVSFGRIADEDVGKDHKELRIVESNEARGWVILRFMRVEGQWKISEIKPTLLYESGDFADITRIEGQPSKRKQT